MTHENIKRRYFEHLRYLNSIFKLKKEKKSQCFLLLQLFH